jgi:hypothetical protein
MSLSGWIAKFQNYCRVERELSENTLRLSLRSDFGEWLPAPRELQAITTDTLRDYLENMRTKRGLSTGTVRRRLACLRSFFRYLDEEKACADPFSEWRVKLPRRKRLPRALSRDENGLLLSFTDLGGDTAQSQCLGVNRRVGPHDRRQHQGRALRNRGGPCLPFKIPHPGRRGQFVEFPSLFRGQRRTIAQEQGLWPGQSDLSNLARRAPLERVTSSLVEPNPCQFLE